MLMMAQCFECYLIGGQKKKIQVSKKEYTARGKDRVNDNYEKRKFVLRKTRKSFLEIKDCKKGNSCLERLKLIDR